MKGLAHVQQHADTYEPGTEEPRASTAAMRRTPDDEDYNENATQNCIMVDWQALGLQIDQEEREARGDIDF